MSPKRKTGGIVVLGTLLTAGSFAIIRSQQPSRDSQQTQQDQLAALLANDPLLHVDDVYSVDGRGVLPEEVKKPNTDALNNLEQNAGFTQEQFEDAYQRSLDTRDQYIKQHLAETLYTQTKDETLLPTLITFALQRHDLQKAKRYLLEADIHDPDVYETLGLEKMLYILMNATPLQREQLDSLKQVIQKFFTQGLLNEAQKNFYWSFIALGKGDFENHKYFLEQLQGTSYQQRTEKLTAAQQQAEQFNYAPEWYAYGVYGVELFYAGWYNYAKYLGQYINQQDPTYPLGYELRAYSHLLLGEWMQAAQMFEIIKQSNDNELFVLLQAIAHYHAESYVEAVLLLSSITDDDLKLDGLRYLLLSYEALDDRAGLFDTARSMVGYEMTPFDYFTLFDYLLFDKQRRGILTSAQTTVMDSVMHQCQIDIGDEYGYICLYGKAGLFASTNDHQKALSLLEGLVNRYPTAAVFERLGDTYYILGEKRKAKRAYMQAFSSGSSTEERAYLRGKILGVLQ